MSIDKNFYILHFYIWKKKLNVVANELRALLTVPPEHMPIAA